MVVRRVRVLRRAAGFVAAGIVGVLGFAVITNNAGAVAGCSLAGVKQWDAGGDANTAWSTATN
jgi:hypothetical protein